MQGTGHFIHSMQVSNNKHYLNQITYTVTHQHIFYAQHASFVLKIQKKTRHKEIIETKQEWQKVTFYNSKSMGRGVVSEQHVGGTGVWDKVRHHSTQQLGNKLFLFSKQSLFFIILRSVYIPCLLIFVICLLFESWQKQSLLMFRSSHRHVVIPEHKLQLWIFQGKEAPLVDFDPDLVLHLLSDGIKSNINHKEQNAVLSLQDISDK